MIKKIKEQSVPYTIMTIAILAFAVFFLCKCWWHYAEVPYAVNEFREAADVQLTEAFLKGEIPYRLKSLDVTAGMPPVIYQYSFLNSAISALFALILGGRVVLAHYLVAILSMIGSAVLVYLLIDRSSQQTVTPILGSTLSLFCHWRFGYLSTSPISLGIFLTLLTFTLAVSKKVKYKALLLALLCVILFYTKLYYITIAGAIFIYFLFYDRAEAFQFFGMSICLGALSVLFVQYFWPLYFTYSLYLLNGTTLWKAFSALLSSLMPAKTGSGHTIVPAMIHPQSFLPPDIIVKPLFLSDAAKYVLEQFGYLIVAFSLLFIILLFGLVMIPVRKKKIRIMENDVLSLAVIQVIVQGLCLFVLGRGDGTYLSYYLQIWMPYVIITAMILVQKDLWLSNKLLNMGMLAFLSLVLLYFGYKKLPLHMMTAEEKDAWKQAKAYVEAAEGKEVYFDTVLEYLAMDQGDRAYHNGHIGSALRIKEMWDADAYAQTFFPYAGKMLDLNIAYQEQMKEKVRNREYGLVAVDDDRVSVDDELLMENGYKLIDELPLSVGTAVYEVRFYVPKEE